MKVRQTHCFFNASSVPVGLAGKRGWGEEREGVGGREGGVGVGSWKDKLLVIFSANLALMCVCEEEGTVAVLYNRGLCWV